MHANSKIISVFTSLFCILFLLFSCSDPKEQNDAYYSPDEKISLKVESGDKGLFYSVGFKGSPLINKSQLSFEFLNQECLNDSISVVSVNVEQIDKVWKPVYGENESIECLYNEIVFHLEENTSAARAFDLVFRISNDGIAYRFIFPENFAQDSLFIVSEDSEFRFVHDMRAWFIPANYESYEMLYDSVALSELKSANTPLTLESYDKDLFVSIHEANLTNYAGMTLLKDSSDALCLHSELVPWPDGIKVKATLPCQTPWRTIQVTESAAGLIESNFILNMNEACVIENTDWIKPVKYVGVWWGMHLGTHTWDMGERHGATTEEMMKFIEFAETYDFDAVLAEGWNTGWENWGQANAFDQITPYDDFDLFTICDSVDSKGLAFIGHHETGGDIETYEMHMDSAFRLYRSLGVHHVKTGYAGGIRPNGYYHHSQYMVEHYRRVVELAARYEICLDVHEPIKATGLSRTFPNMMTREGARGMEWNAWSSGNPPQHHVILPFTRCLAGPLDYTPGIFDLTYKNAKGRVKWNDQDKGNSRVNTTLAKQLALFVLFYSPMQMASDLPENYVNQPAFEFVKEVPVDWSKTVVPVAEIGEKLCVVRKDKNSEDWFLGAVTGDHQTKMEILLDFLDGDAEYIAHIYADGEEANWESNPYDIEIYELTVDNASSVSLKIAQGGGAAIWFEKQ